MTLKVLFFSILRPIVGGEEIEVEVADSANVGTLLTTLYETYPDLKDWDGKIRVAVDLEYVDRDHPLAPGQEIAIMPPVQGG